MVKIVQSKTEFDSLIQGKVVLVDFFAEWCPPCKMIGPFVDELSQKYTNVLFLKVNVDECDDIAAKYAVSAMPTFIVLKNNEKVDELVGADKTRLEALAKKYN